MKAKHLSLIAGALLGLASAGAQSSTIAVTPNASLVAPGTASINLSIDGSGFPLDTTGGGLSVSWLDSVLSLGSITYDPMWDQGWNTTVSTSPAGVTNVTFLPVGFFGGTNAGSDFHLMNLTLNVVGGAGSTTPINLEVPALNGWYDSNANLLQVAAVDGSFAVMSPVPVPAAGWLLLSGLPFVFRMARRSGAAA